MEDDISLNIVKEDNPWEVSSLFDFNYFYKSLQIVTELEEDFILITMIVEIMI